MLAGKIGYFRESLDPAAAAYIAAVEAADGQSLEAAVRTAINNFVFGCKADGIWSAIKASCILMGARTLAGALTPLAGAAPTNNNFVSGDYSRRNGLTGNGSNKWLNTNRSDASDPQNNHHMCFVGTTPIGYMMGRGFGNNAGNSVINVAGQSETTVLIGSRCAGTGRTIAGSVFACSRSSSTSFDTVVNGSVQSHAVASAAPSSGSVFVFATNFFNNGTAYNITACRCQFYSMGQSLSLSALHLRLTTLAASISSAVP